MKKKLKYVVDKGPKNPFDLLKGRENFDSWENGVKAYLTIKFPCDWTTKKPDTSKPDEISKNAKAKGELTLLIAL